MFVAPFGDISIASGYGAIVKRTLEPDVNVHNEKIQILGQFDSHAPR
jgi:hypothetical protein